MLLTLNSLLAFSVATSAASAHIVKPQPPHSRGHVCTVIAHGNKTDDTPQILAAFKKCNHGGKVVFPRTENYWIATKLNPIIHDVTIDWKGTWTMSDDLAYWRNNSYPIAFQNHHAGFIISGSKISIDGFGTGGINGNGNAWYNDEKAITRPGRPMPFVFWNVSEVRVENFYVKDPPLWSLNIMNGTNMHFNNIICNATALKVPYGTNWVQNTDGFDTMDAHNISLTNFIYQGGDDCIAIKPRSYNIYVQNMTCHGGNGPAIGSLGQYLEDSSVINVTVRDAQILTYNGKIGNGLYIKTWVGALVPQPTDYESEFLPRGGGWGNVSNILIENFYLQGASIGAVISQDSGDNGSYAGTSKMLVSDVTFRNFSGYTNAGTTGRTASVSCSSVEPCFGIVFEGFDLAGVQNGTGYGAKGLCSYTAKGGVTGLSGCSS